jgi:protein-L-isoaspartate(D-aspartate) O-methyltransferase
MKTLLLISILCMNIFTYGVQADDFARQRQRMIHDIEDMVAHTEDYIGKPELDQRVMEIMATVPRHEFVPDEILSHAYVNSALPITHGQTISQPYIVALMTDLAAVNKDSLVLEVGTGSGYQAAVLAELVKHVYTIEIIEPLGLQAKDKLQQLGYDNITVKIGDGYRGWPEHAPFDAILVTASAEQVPLPLIEQLKPGGKLVIPIGRQHATQTLTVIEKNTDGEIQRHDILPVGFVPLTGDH